MALNDTYAGLDTMYILCRCCFVGLGGSAQRSRYRGFIFFIFSLNHSSLFQKSDIATVYIGSSISFKRDVNNV